MSCDFCGGTDFQLLVCECGCVHCYGCALGQECGWCDEDYSICPACTQLAIIDDMISCLPCIRKARDLGIIRYCRNHKVCYRDDDELAVYYHDECNTTNNPKVLEKVMAAAWPEL